MKPNMYIIVVMDKYDGFIVRVYFATGEADLEKIIQGITYLDTIELYKVVDSDECEQIDIPNDIKMRHK